MARRPGACVEGCGVCCDPVVLPFTQFEALTDPRLPNATKEWVTTVLRPMPRREAKEKFPELFARPTVGFVGGQAVPDAFFYSCGWFDPDTRACTRWDERPDACREYPWYGGPPHPDAAIPPTCGYNRDVGRVPVAITPKPGS